MKSLFIAGPFGISVLVCYLAACPSFAKGWRGGEAEGEGGSITIPEERVGDSECICDSFCDFQSDENVCTKRLY